MYGYVCVFVVFVLRMCVKFLLWLYRFVGLCMVCVSVLFGVLFCFLLCLQNCLYVWCVFVSLLCVCVCVLFCVCLLLYVVIMIVYVRL